MLGCLVRQPARSGSACRIGQYLRKMLVTSPFFASKVPISRVIESLDVLGFKEDFKRDSLGVEIALAKARCKVFFRVPPLSESKIKFVTFLFKHSQIRTISSGAVVLTNWNASF